MNLLTATAETRTVGISETFLPMRSRTKNAMSSGVSRCEISGVTDARVASGIAIIANERGMGWTGHSGRLPAQKLYSNGTDEFESS